MTSKIDETKIILEQIGMPKKQCTEISALTILAMASIKEQASWKLAENNWIRIHDIIQFVNNHYNKSYAENSRETFRKQAIHHFRIAGIIEDNGKATNSPNFRYRLTPEFLNTLKSFGSKNWENKISDFLSTHETLKSKYESKRILKKIPLTINDQDFQFSPGIHNELQKAIIEEFAPRFAQGAEVIYVGDTINKSLVLDKKRFEELNFSVIVHDKMPDVVLYHPQKNWLYFIEAVTSVGELSPKRIIEIEQMTKKCSAGNIFVTAFPDIKTYKKFAGSLAWETEVWLSELPEHMIHLNGDKFMGPRK
ncbi:BsuBI/PstI family type II restriction endonuclease [Lactococcus lactis]|uniref:BsuBI/PstI family type II restriction endonuclease n=1 Tax=Lactococcus lactis TaxID=1358 RepID=UPI0018C7F602|nr:BsuBI/PstI family type II restriction endonuclease [Lactococcus lactis]MBG1278082.1 restriction endonuclease [Lactococcus lactis subsp. lactis]